jgi:hypothetical protein
LFDAASISNTSIFAPSSDLQTSHFPQGEPFFDSEQLIAFANIFAVLVLPVPLLPVKRYACEILSNLI